MYDTLIEPRFSETDALTHIGNTVLPVWFEHARGPLFKAVHPTLDVRSWPLILARMEVDFLQQMFVGYPVTIKTGLSKIGGKSFTIYHEAWQRDVLAAKGTAVMVYFDYQQQTTVPIPDEARSKLTPFLIDQT